MVTGRKMHGNEGFEAAEDLVMMDVFLFDWALREEFADDGNMDDNGVVLD